MQRFTPSTYDKARREDAYRRLSRIVRGRDRARPLLDLDDVRDHLRVFDQHYVGIEPIPVAKIVGTAGRSEDFGQDFAPLKPDSRERWLAVERAFPEGLFPPIVVYQVGDRYFVVDGHHRVGIAKRSGVEMIDAEVTVLETRFELPEDADIGKLIAAEQRAILMQESGLERARPEADITCSRPYSYIELLELIEVHGYHLMRQHGEVLPREEIAADWYDRVYLPTVETIRSERLEEVCRGTDADLFLWVWERRRTLNPERGGITLDEAARVARGEARRRPRKLFKRDAD